MSVDPRRLVAGRTGLFRSGSTRPFAGQQAWLAGAIAGSVALGVALGSPATNLVLIVCAVLIVLALTVWLPPHLFLAGCVVVLATESAFESHAYHVGSMSVYPFDALLLLVALRASLPRDRNRPRHRIIDLTVGVPVLLWIGAMLLAGVRGHLDGNGFGSIARMETPIVYLPAFCWAFRRVLLEKTMQPAKVLRNLIVTSVAFIAYAAFARITHHRFQGPEGFGIGNVPTTSGLLRRDYGLFSAFELYPLLMLGGLAYVLFGRRPSSRVAAVASIAAAATIMTLIRGIIFGAAAGLGALILIAWHTKTKRRFSVTARLLLPIAFFALAAVPFMVLSPATAHGVAERFLPGLLPQTKIAEENTQFREHVLRSGEQLANVHVFGIGFVRPETMTNAGYPPLYVPHSHWAALLAFTGWPGLVAFASTLVALVRRSARLPAEESWLHPFIVAATLLMVVQGFGWNVLFTMVSSLGFFAIAIALRFGLFEHG